VVDCGQNSPLGHEVQFASVALVVYPVMPAAHVQFRKDALPGGLTV
jgi:uncharacterized membrane protein (DUF4010 family)